MAFNVFISHSISDSHVVDQFKSVLEVNGIGVYIALIQPQYGTSLPLKVSKAISRSDCVIAVLTQNGARSEWVNQEIGYASRSGKTIIPVVEDGIELKGFVAGVEYITFKATDPAAAITDVTKYVSKLKTGKEQQEKLEAVLIVLVGILAIAAISQK
jgi:hypothetical protein